MSNLLITIKVPFVCNIGPMVSTGSVSYMRLCDGLTDIIAGGNTYKANIFVNMDGLEHGINLYAGGGLETDKDFSFTILNNSLIETIEMGGNSLNSGEVQIDRLLDNLTIEHAYHSFINGSELGSNVLTLKCRNIEPGLGTVKNVQAFGSTYKLELIKDASISNKSVLFDDGGGLGKHPIILKTYSSQNPTNNPTNYYGVEQYHVSTGGTSLLISHKNDVFKNVGATSGTKVKDVDGLNYFVNYKNLLLKFITGNQDNIGNLYRIKALSRVVDVDGSNSMYQTMLHMKNDFGSIDIKSFDRIEIYDGVTYYLIDDHLVDQINCVYVKDSNNYYGINGESWTIETIAGKKYISVYSSSNIYSEVPVTVNIEAESTLLDKGFYYTGTPLPIAYSGTETVLDPTYVTDTDMSNFYGCAIPSIHFPGETGTSYLSKKMIKVFMKPDFRNFEGKDIYFGATVDRPTTIGTWHCLNYRLKSGAVSPCNMDGTLAYTPFYEYDSDGITMLRGAPNNGISAPDNHVGDGTEWLQPAWNFVGSNWTFDNILSPNCKFTHNGTFETYPNAAVMNITPFEMGHCYQIDFDISNYLSGNAELRIGGNVYHGLIRSGSLIYTAKVASSHIDIISNMFVGTISLSVTHITTTDPTPYNVIANSAQSSNVNKYHSANNPLALTTSNITEANFWQFIEGDMHKLDIDKSIYADISTIQYTIYNRTTNEVNGDDDKNYVLIYRVGLWAKIPLDEQDSIYVDCLGNSFAKHGKPDTVAKLLIEQSGQVTTTDFDNLLLAENLYTLEGDELFQGSQHLYNLTGKELTSAAIHELAKESMIAVATKGDGTYYSKSIDITNTTPEVVIPTGNILGISKQLNDIEISNIINLPKISFKDLSNNEQTLELVDIVTPMPSLADFLTDQTKINSVYVLSGGFLDAAIKYSDLTSLYNLILKPIYDACKLSYNKNKMYQKGEVKIVTTYLEHILRPIDGPLEWQMILDLQAEGWAVGANWIHYPTGWFTTFGNGGLLTNNTITFAIDEKYKLYYDCDNNSGGSFNVTLAGKSVNNIVNIAYGQYDFYADNNNQIVVTPTSGFNGHIAIRVAKEVHSKIPSNLPANLIRLIKTLSQRRKTITLTVPLSYRNTLVGARVSMYDPRVMSSHTILGFVENVITNLKDSTVNVTILCDSYLDGSGGIDFF